MEICTDRCSNDKYTINMACSFRGVKQMYDICDGLYFGRLRVFSLMDSSGQGWLSRKRSYHILRLIY